MHQLTSLVVVATLFAACGGGGGGGGVTGPTPSTTVDLGTGTVAATAGRLVIVDAPSPLFAPGIDYVAQWTANGAAFGTARVRAIDADSLAMLVPTLPDGSYEARVTLPSVVARTRFVVTAAPTIANAGATVASAHAALAARASSLRTEANAEPDAAIRSARLADLGRIDQWLANLDMVRATAPPVDVFLAATVFEQNPILRGQIVALAFDETDRFAKVTAGLAVAHGMAPEGMGAVAIGLAPGLPTLVSAALISGGLVAVAHALPAARAALQLPYKPIDGLVLQVAPATGTVIVQPSLNVGSGTAVTLVAHANFGSLAAIDRTIGGADLAPLLADLDAARAPFVAVPPAVAAWIENRPDDLPEQRIVERSDVAIDRISIEVQSNPLVLLALTAPQLTATSFAGATPVSTIGLFRYEAGAQGSLTTPVTVNVTP